MIMIKNDISKEVEDNLVSTYKMLGWKEKKEISKIENLTPKANEKFSKKIEKGFHKKPIEDNNDEE